jgi:hypothetical protein
LVDRPDGRLEVRERACARYVEAGNRRRAGFVALKLGHDYDLKRRRAIAAAWEQRAERLLADEPGVSRARVARS